MVDATHLRYPANDRSYFSILKKDIHQFAVKAGFDKRKLDDLALILSELTSNLHKYTKGGEILCGLLKDNGEDFLELICIDEGPGMTDVSRMMIDGISTTGTMGVGLGSIKRLSTEFDIYSQKGWGTILLSRLYKWPARASQSKLVDVRPLVLSMPGQVTSGDGYYYKLTETHFKLLLADGLGHGPEANYAINEGINSFKSCPHDTPSKIIKYIHSSIKQTRGMVAVVIVFDFKLKRWQMAGVGNIATRMSNFLEIRNLMSYNGIIGHNIPNTISDQIIAVEDFHQLTLCSDGLKSQWDLTQLSGITRCDLSVQAAAIYKQYGRRTDDMSVIMAKINQRLCK
jgi:anti-sigma regulatory factor (Ser/Thr protein kinase)